MRKELIDAYLFSLDEVKIFAEQCRLYYNHEKTHPTIGFVAPAEYI